MSVDIVERLRLNEDDWLFGQTARDARREITTLREQVEKLTKELALLKASLASATEGFTMSEPAILPDGSGFGTMTEREATLLGKVERQSAALKLAREALQGIHPGNMTPMAEKNWMEAIAAIDEVLNETKENK